MMSGKLFRFSVAGRSVLSALFDARNPERQELTNEFFSRIDEHVVFISELTRVEIEETPDEELRDKMRGVIADFHSLWPL
jgi:hypothetical protein